MASNNNTTSTKATNTNNTISSNTNTLATDEENKEDNEVVDNFVSEQKEIVNF